VLWLFKIFAVPILVAAATLAVRRWGARVGGLMMGLPVMTGPVVLFLAVDQGEAFAARATTAVLLAVAALGPWTLTLHRLAGRYSLVVALTAALLVFFAISFVLQSLVFGLRPAALLATLSVLASLLLMPQERTLLRAAAAPWWDIWFRMIVTAGLVVAVTLLADRLGPRISGLLGSLPIVSGVVVCFTLQQSGAAVARAVLRGVTTAMLAFIAFFLVVGETIEAWGIAASYAAAVGLALPFGFIIATLDRRFARPPAPSSAAITKALE
jgi:hypothetical protein